MADKKYRTQAFGGDQTPLLMRVSYAFSMIEGKENEKGVMKYTPTFIIPKSNTAGVALLQNAIAEVVEGEWGEKGLHRFKNELIKNPLLDGASKSARDAETGEFKAGLGPDVYFIRATSNEPILVFNKQLGQITKRNDCPSGWWGYPVLNAFCWHHPTNGDGVSFGCSMFKYAKEDESLGGDAKPDPARFFRDVQAAADETRERTSGGQGAAGLFG